MAARRYPLAPLLEASGMTITALNRRLPMGGEVYRLAKSKGLTPLIAERYAILIGLHPATIWESWAEDEFEELSKECRECGERFIRRPDALFCSRLCGNRHRQRVYWRKKYASDPEFREREKARRRAYYDEYKDYEAKRGAAWKRANPRPISEAKREGNRRYYQRHRERILAAKRRAA